ncbi:MAG: hypothetical protein SGI98_06165 [Verrucomicrobiota bacterium]|nr:hypothetical protein [Verrucomicrobiota bacterium]
MKGDRFDIFYAKIEFTDLFRQRVYEEGKSLADSIFCLKSEFLNYNILLVDQNSRYPLTVFLRPDLEARMKRKVKDCCDKACNICILGCADTPSVGFLIKERVKSYFKKDSHLRGLYQDEIPDTLHHLNLESFILEEKELNMLLAGSGFEQFAQASESRFIVA